MATRKTNLGELEMAVLDHLWNSGEGDVRAVHKIVGTEREVSSNTIQSTLERLYRKSLLSREKVRHAYVYRPAVTRPELISRYIDDVIETFSGDRGNHALAAFVDWLDRADAETLEQLEALLAERRAAQSRGS